MNYYIDTEFMEGPQQKTLFGLPVPGKTKPTIDLISIGIVAEDGREYYAISKDFNLDEAWNRFDVKTEQMSGDMRNIYHEGRKYKEYWLRENVLRPIYVDLIGEHDISPYSKDWAEAGEHPIKFTHKNLKWLIQKYGKTNDQIAKEVKEFVLGGSIVIDSSSIPKDFDAEAFRKAWTEQGVFVAPKGTVAAPVQISNTKPTFYAYYADYDWVVFCWLWGRMIDLPKGFPRYCIDLKQTLDDRLESDRIIFSKRMKYGISSTATMKEDGNMEVHHLSFDEKLNRIKAHEDYPKQTNEHNALADARWNKKLHEFINSL